MATVNIATNITSSNNILESSKFIFIYNDANDANDANDEYKEIIISVPYDLAIKFAMVSNFKTDLPEYEKEPIKIYNLHDSYNTPVYFTVSDLQLYFKIFELCISAESFDLSIFTENKITPDDAIKYILLTMYLDNEIFLDNLLTYEAHTIYNSIM